MILKFRISIIKRKIKSHKSQSKTKMITVKDNFTALIKVTFNNIIKILKVDRINDFITRIIRIISNMIIKL